MKLQCYFSLFELGMFKLLIHTSILRGIPIILNETTKLNTNSVLEIQRIPRLKVLKEEFTHQFIK
jgi:hypothetical protein